MIGNDNSNSKEYKTIETEHLVLRCLGPSYTNYVLSFLVNNKDEFEKYEAKKVPMFYTYDFQESVLRNEYEAARRGDFIRYYIFKKPDYLNGDIADEIIGTVSFGCFILDPYRSFVIGYKFAPNHQNKGFGTEAVHAALDRVFSHFKPHKVNAYVLPDNVPSIRLLEKCDFHQEGFCIKHLCVNGEWKDHILYAKLNEIEV